MNPPPLPPPLPPSAAAVRTGHISRLTSRLVRWLAIAFAVAMVAAVAFLGVRIWQLKQHWKDYPPVIVAGEEELKQAVLRIGSNNEGNAHGNSPEAQALAQRVSQQMKAIREALFTGGDSGSIDMQVTTHGEFVVFCQLNPHSCAFLIHAPDMRSYTMSAKDSLVQAACLTAAKTLDNSQHKGVNKLAVATRGNLLFDRILIGDYCFKDEAPLSHAQSVTGQWMLAPSLHPFFASASSQSSKSVP